MVLKSINLYGKTFNRDNCSNDKENYRKRKGGDMSKGTGNFTGYGAYIITR